MPVRLDQPLSTTPNAAETAMLASLQGNILKGHGRRVTAHAFLRFDATRSADVRAFLKSLAPRLTRADTQMAAAMKFRAARKAGKKPPPGAAFVQCVLSATGYAALGIPAAAQPSDPAFAAGMKARRTQLADARPPTWDKPYRGEVHAMLLIGGDPDNNNPAKSKQVDAALAALLAAAPAGAVSVLGIERGRAYFNANKNGVEHFGYVDGRSQPLLLEDDFNRETATTDGTIRWDPRFPLNQVLVRDPGLNNPDAFGSYFVYRKLEQNVARFKAAEEALGKKLASLAKKNGEIFDPELAGAMLVGRFEDGTPVLLQNGAGMHNPVPNDFDFAGDMQGLKCPFHAHIRKTNPRGDTQRLFNAPLKQERAHIMARRGITYGSRKQNAKQEFTDKPTRDVGLLFMAFQSDIANQFEFTQQAWANTSGFARPGTGPDPVIGQTSGKLTHTAGWGNAGAPKHTASFAAAVKLKGGEYFFAPSVPFFAGL